MPKFKIFVVRATRRRQVDNYGQGCSFDSISPEETLFFQRSYPSVLDAFRDIVGDKTITAADVTTMDPNIYRDIKEGPKVVTDNVANGLFRCCFNRTENSRWKAPSAGAIEQWKKGKATMYLADYDLVFTVRLVGIEEEPLAKILGVSNW